VWQKEFPMRYFLFLMAMAALLMGGEDPASHFQSSKEHQLLCRESTYSYMLLSQANATIVELKGHTFFKVKGENRYLPKTACQPLTEKEAIVF
jgi:hypothetical protein